MILYFLLFKYRRQQFICLRRLRLLKSSHRIYICMILIYLYCTRPMAVFFVLRVFLGKRNINFVKSKSVTSRQGCCWWSTDFVFVRNLFRNHHIEFYLYSCRMTVGERDSLRMTTIPLPRPSYYNVLHHNSTRDMPY